jgi:elongation factor Ts
MSTITITAAEINNLRKTTSAGMMDCRKALEASNGDFEAAIDWLRKQGQKVASKRQDREAKEGVVIAQTTADHKTGFVLCLSCETDFVSKNADFVAFAQSIMDTAIKHNIKTIEELNNTSLDGVAIAEKINEQVGKIAEKINITRFERIEAEAVAAYIHGAYRMGVLVGFNKANEVGKDVAMQIAAMNPVAIDESSVSPEVIAREKAIVMDLIKNDPKMAGKPEEMLEKIAAGKLNTFFKESTLLAQSFVKDNSQTVGDYVKSVDSALKVTAFKRVALG